MASGSRQENASNRNLPLQELDQGGVDLVGPLLLDPVTGPIENELLPQIRQHALHLVDQLGADQPGNDAILRSRDEQRRLVDLRALPRRGQFPVAVDVAIPVQPAAEAGLSVDLRESRRCRLRSASSATADSDRRRRGIPCPPEHIDGPPDRRTRVRPARFASSRRHRARTRPRRRPEPENTASRNW